MNRAEELIADLEAEIVKRDARIEWFKEDREKWAPEILRKDARIAELEQHVKKFIGLTGAFQVLAKVDQSINDRNSRLMKLEQQRGGVVLPDPFGWVGGGLFFYDRDKAIEAAAESPCVEVYSRPQILAVINPTGAYLAAIDWPDAPITVESGFIVVDGKHLPTITLTMPAVLPSDMPAWDKRDNLTAYIRTILAQQGKAVES